MTTQPMTADLESRAERSRQKPEVWPCVCAFAKSVDETDPYKFPRAGFQTNVIYRCRLIIQHDESGIYAIQPETKGCCPEWFRSNPSQMEDQ